MKALRFAIALLAALPLRAHDLWIVPATFEPAVGETIAVHLEVGEPHLGEAERVARNPLRLVRWVAFEGETIRDLPGVDGRDPAGYYRPETPGGTILVYQGSHAFLELPAERFEHHLAEQGLEAISRLRSERGLSDEPGRERYRRSIKALLAVGGGPARDRALGLPFELVIAGDPALGGGAALAARLFYQGQPLAGALVELTSLDRPGPAVGRRSDRTGRVSFPAPGGGRWLLTAVHMVPATADSGADWESSWTSLAWEVAARP